MWRRNVPTRRGVVLGRPASVHSSRHGCRVNGWSLAGQAQWTRHRAARAPTPRGSRASTARSISRITSVLVLGSMSSWRPRAPHRTLHPESGDERSVDNIHSDDSRCTILIPEPLVPHMGARSCSRRPDPPRAPANREGAPTASLRVSGHLLCAASCIPSARRTTADTESIARRILGLRRTSPALSTTMA